MTDSPSSDQTSTSVLTKLLDVDADLASQEATLLVQLEAVREKRHSLRSVIGMFSSTDAGSTPATPATPAAPATRAKPGRKPKESKAQDAEKTAPVADEVTPPEPSTPASPPEAETEAPAPVKSGRGRRANPDKPKRNAKPARKLEGWQRYVRAEFGKTPLPEAVSVVLQRQPEDIIEVPAIVDAIFEQEMPQTVRNKARDRILHVLSAGVKENKWHRGRTGQYSLSRNAAASNKAS
ncbi:MAG: hypothetical protein KME12_20610 [Trichocoleus desertorum ATA4-8-CV12]|nr:hypothetical protein [Trichocoleus desertorum ATA4-8-CV12]